ncbi:MAG: hypothetical protein QXP66_04440 [Candidatus Aenigmatarchaeota archaeon]
MKNLVFSLLLLSGLFILFSCEKEQLGTPDAIDTIVLLDEKGNVQVEYRYDRNKEVFIGDAPTQKSGCNDIPGDLVSKEPNNHGGYNYTCMANPCAVCYTRCPQQ